MANTAALGAILERFECRKPYLHSFEMVFTDRTAGLKISHRQEEHGRQLVLQSNAADCYLLGTQVQERVGNSSETMRKRPKTAVVWPGFELGARYFQMSWPYFARFELWVYTCSSNMFSQGCADLGVPQNVYPVARLRRFEARRPLRTTFFPRFSSTFAGFRAIRGLADRSRLPEPQHRRPFKPLRSRLMSTCRS